MSAQTVINYKSLSSYQLDSLLASRSLATVPEQLRNLPRQTNPHQPHAMTPSIPDEPIKGAVQ